MDSVIITPRLKLTLMNKAERGSQEFEWLHQLHTNEKSTWWRSPYSILTSRSLRGQSKTVEDTENRMKFYLPSTQQEPMTYKVVYAVHEILNPLEQVKQSEARAEDLSSIPTRFIGLINIGSLGDGSLPLPEELTIPATAAATTLQTEIAYQFLPISWGHGYAGEAINAVFEACKRSPSFWAPFSKVHVRAMVNAENPRSVKVMQKIPGMLEKGIYEWSGKPIFIGGRWRESDSLRIFGMYLLE